MLQRSYALRPSRWLFERQIADEAWVLFAPHHAGLPAVVDEVTHFLLHAADDGADVEECVRRTHARWPATSEPALRVLLAASSTLGFLTDQAEAPRFRAMSPEPRQGTTLAAWLELTTRCNLACSYCFVGKTERDMTGSALERAVEALARTAVARRFAHVDLRFGGGEPSLVLPLVERAHELLSSRLRAAGIALSARIVTNGTLVNERLLTFLRRTGVDVAVSLDGYGPAHDVHRRFRGAGAGSWALVSDNVDRLVAAGADVCIAATLSEESCVSLPRLLDWTVPRSLPVHLQWVSEPKRPWSGEAPSASDYATFNERLIAALDETFRGLEDRLARGEDPPGVTLDQLAVETPHFERCCGMATSYVAFTQDGQIAPCPRLARTRTTSYADDVVSSASMLLRSSPGARDEREADPCLECQWFPVCVGGCPATNESVNGDELSVSPLCALRRFAIPRYVEHLGRRLLAGAKASAVTEFRLLRIETKRAGQLGSAEHSHALAAQRS